MSLAETVEFALRGVVQGVEISPQHVPFGLMTKFHEEVAQLVLGSNQGSLADTLVEIRRGSYALVLPPPASVRESFERDMALLDQTEATAYPDPKRLAVLQAWQRRATMETGLTYLVRPKTPRALFREFLIDARTTLRRPAPERWVNVELMVLGEVREAGGEKANIHIRIRDSEQTLIVAVNPDQLRDEPYPLFREKLLRVAAEQNVRTKELRKPRLIEFVRHNPQFDERAFELMTEAGAKAWADVPDAAGWVRETRGGGND